MKRFYTLASLAALLCCAPFATAADQPASADQAKQQATQEGGAANDVTALESGITVDAAVRSLRSALSDVQRHKSAAAPKNSIRGAVDPHIMPQEVQGVRATARGAAAEQTRSIGEGTALQQGRTAPIDTQPSGAVKKSRASTRSNQSGAGTGEASSLNPRLKSQ